MWVCIWDAVVVVALGVQYGIQALPSVSLQSFCRESEDWNEHVFFSA